MTTDKSVPPAITPQQNVPRPDGPDEHGLTPVTPPPPPPNGSDEELPDDETLVGPSQDDGPGDQATAKAPRIGAMAKKARSRATRKKPGRTAAPPAPPADDVVPEPRDATQDTTSGASDDASGKPTTVADAAVAEAFAPAEAVLDEAQRSSGVSTVEVSMPATAWDTRKDEKPYVPSAPAPAVPTPVTPAQSAPAAAPATVPEATGPAAGGPAGSVSYAGAGVTGKATAELAKPAPDTTGLPREIRLSVARVDPWSVLKLALILSFAVAIVIIVATAMFWYTLDGMQVFQKLNDFVKQIAGEESKVNVLQFVEFSKVMSVAVVIAVVNIVLTTALATLGTMIYNVVARLVGGLHMTLMDD